MGLGATDYLRQLQALLPTGAAWPRDPDSVLTHLLAGMAEEPARVDARAWQLIEEADPRTSSELLESWERIAGTTPEEGASLETRRADVVAILTSRGGQSKPYFIALAGAMGYAITITEFRPFCAGSSTGGLLSNVGSKFSAGSVAGDSLEVGNWRFCWQVNVLAGDVHTFTSGSAAGEPLRSWGDSRLEGVIRKWAPAHTHVQFTYS